MFTARYILHSTFCPHSVFMCFVWIWEQTAIISLYSIDWLVFITETECVYCAVRFETLYVTHVFISVQRVKTNTAYCFVAMFERSCEQLCLELGQALYVFRTCQDYKLTGPLGIFMAFLIPADVKIMVKVHFILEQATKAPRWSGGIAVHFFEPQH